MVFQLLIKSGSFERTYIPEKATFNNIKKIAALSDIHGQYDLESNYLKITK